MFRPVNPFAQKPTGPLEPEGKLVRNFLGDEAEAIHARLKPKNRGAGVETYTDLLPGEEHEMTERENLLTQAARMEREADELFGEMIKATLVEKVHFDRSLAVGSLVDSLAKAEKIEQMEEFIAAIKENYILSGAYSTLALTLVKAGRDPSAAFSGAEQAAIKSETDNEYVYSKALFFLASARAQVGDFREAENLIEQITNSEYRSQGLSTLAVALSKDGQDPSMEFKQAEAIAQVAGESSDSLEVSSAMSKLVSALAQVGRFEEATRVCSMITVVLPYLEGAYASISESLAKAGKFEEAEDIILNITETRIISESLSSLGSELTKAGRDASAVFQKAERLSLETPGTYFRCMALIKLATALTQAGQDPRRILNEVGRSFEDGQDDLFFAEKVEISTELAAVLTLAAKAFRQRADELKD